MSPIKIKSEAVASQAASRVAALVQQAQQILKGGIPAREGTPAKLDQASGRTIPATGGNEAATSEQIIEALGEENASLVNALVK